MKGIVLLISTSLFLFGGLSVALEIGSFLYCDFCARTLMTPQRLLCEWTFPLQGLWRGCLVSLCGLAGIVHAFIQTRCCNLAMVIISCLTTFFCLAATGFDIIRLLRVEWFRDSIQTFTSQCLDPRTWISDMQWDVFIDVSLVVGGCCSLLCMLLFFVTGCVQCCSTLSSTRTSNEATELVDQTQTTAETGETSPLTASEDCEETESYCQWISPASSIRDPIPVPEPCPIGDLITFTSDDEEPPSYRPTRQIEVTDRQNPFELVYFTRMSS